MNIQYLQYVREQLMVATADLSGVTKGQLEAWLEHAQFDTGTYKRKKPRILDEVTGRMITLDNPPISGKQSYAKGSSIALVSQVEFSTSSWRRAVLSLEEHQKAWLLWSYSESVRWEHQVAKSGTKFRHFKATMLAAIRYPAEKNEFCKYAAIVCSLAVIAVRFSTCMQSTMSKSNST